jgi:hypothetical protein
MPNNAFPRVDQGKIIAFVISMVLVTGFVAFEVFNAATTYAGFNFLFKNQLFASTLAIAVVCVDLGGLSRILTPQTGRDEPRIIQILTSVWLLVALVNAGLTWYVISLSFQYSPPLMPTALVGHTEMVAVILSCLIFAVHVAMIYTLGVYLDVRLHNGRRVGTPLAASLRQGAPVTRTAVPQPAAQTQMFRPESTNTAQRAWRTTPPPPAESRKDDL